MQLNAIPELSEICKRTHSNRLIDKQDAQIKARTFLVWQNLPSPTMGTRGRDCRLRYGFFFFARIRHVQNGGANERKNQNESSKNILLTKVRGNQSCCDCGASQPTWVRFDSIIFFSFWIMVKFIFSAVFGVFDVLV